MPNFHDHRGVVDNGLNDGLDFLKDIVRQAKEIDTELDYLFVFTQDEIESALYKKDSKFYIDHVPVNTEKGAVVYCYNKLRNVDVSEQDGICNKTGLSMYQIKMALCRIMSSDSGQEIHDAVLNHVKVPHTYKRWGIRVAMA